MSYQAVNDIEETWVHLPKWQQPISMATTWFQLQWRSQKAQWLLEEERVDRQSLEGAQGSEATLCKTVMVDSVWTFRMYTTQNGP